MGRVLLLMSETAWVDRCQVMVASQPWVSLVAYLSLFPGCSQKGFAVTKKNHMEMLFKLTDKAGIPRPVVEEKSLDTSMREEGEEVKTRIAFLSLGK